jgi:hypothetical protein
MKDDKLKPRTVLTSAGYIADEDDDIQVYQRPWVGLTNGEIYTAYVEAANQTLRPQDERIALAFARAIEAKLKEKNNG